MRIRLWCRYVNLSTGEVTSVGDDIRVTSISPDGFTTNLGRGLLAESQEKMGDPQHVVNLVRYVLEQTSRPGRRQPFSLLPCVFLPAHLKDFDPGRLVILDGFHRRLQNRRSAPAGSR